MKIKLLAAMGALLFAASSVVAQTPGTLGTLEFQKPKNGMVKQYEDGRKQKAAWHKQQNDSQPLMVWETLTGDNTGVYLVGRFGQHWADLDKPSVPDQADIDEYNKVIGNYVESLTTRYYNYLPKISNPTSSPTPSKFAEILTFHVRYGKASEFRNAINRVDDAIQKTKWPLKHEWYELVSGGATGTFVLVLPHDNYADFADNPNVKPFRDMLKEGLGQAEADSIINEFDSSVQNETSEIIQFRPDLSYLPTK